MITLTINGQAVTVGKTSAGRVSWDFTDPLNPPAGSVLHAMVDRIAELEAQLAAVGAGGVTAGVPLMGEPDSLAADGLLFRRVFEAMVSENETFADNMDRIAGGREGDEPPTLEEMRAMLTEALAP